MEEEGDDPEEKVENIAEVLYDVGLCVNSTLFQKKIRKLIYNPFLILTVNSITVVTKTIIMNIDQGDNYFLMILGDVGHHFNMKDFLSFIFILWSLVVILSQCVYYYNYKHGVEPTFIKVFEIIDQRQDSDQFSKLNSRMRILFDIAKFNNKYLTTALGFLFVMATFIVNNSLGETLIYGLANSLFTALWVHYCWNILGYQCMFFLIMCQYLKLKMIKLNTDILSMLSGKKFISIKNILDSYDELYREINEYNTTYWSKFLFILWTIFGIAIVFILNLLIFKPVHIFNRIILVYVVVIMTIVYALILGTASSVNLLINRYKDFNKLFISSSKRKCNNKLILLRIKLDNFIECMAFRKVGFSCWLIFIINYFRFYGVSIIIDFLGIEGDEYIISLDPPPPRPLPPASDPDQPIEPKPMGPQPMGPQPR